MTWQDDVLMFWQDKLDEIDDDETVPEICWDAATKEEDGETAE